MQAIIFLVYFLYITIPACLIGAALHLCINGCKDSKQDNEVSLLNI